jgi:hypothetical protein
LVLFYTALELTPINNALLTGLIDSPDENSPYAPPVLTPNIDPQFTEFTTDPPDHEP